MLVTVANTLMKNTLSLLYYTSVIYSLAHCAGFFNAKRNGGKIILW